MKRKLIPGDILVADRGLYRHYGIYAGKSRVIHYVTETGDFGPDIRVRETGMGIFAKGRPFYVCMVNGGSGFSARKTLRRAKSCVGSGGYNLFTNNCEHFVVWCKTGQSRSWQIDKAVEVIAGIPLIGEGLYELLQEDGMGETRFAVQNALFDFFDTLTDGIYGLADKLDELRTIV
jgi:hypothetical protein